MESLDFTAGSYHQPGKKNAGLYANLFYFNQQTGELEFICSDEIDAEGNTRLVFTHASDYIVVVDEKPMGSADDGMEDSGSEAGTGDEKSQAAGLQNHHGQAIRGFQFCLSCPVR